MTAPAITLGSDTVSVQRVHNGTRGECDCCRSVIVAGDATYLITRRLGSRESQFGKGRANGVYTAPVGRCCLAMEITGMIDDAEQQLARRMA